MRHLINFIDYQPADIAAIIEKAMALKADPAAYHNALSRRKLYMLFQKTSTRTSLSFSTGITDLGGACFVQNWQDTNFAVGEMQDEVRYVGRNVDLIMARLKLHEDIVEMARHAAVPVINGCCNKFHPCQALADMLTIRELFGTYNIKMLYIGVRNNVLNSLLETLPRLGGELYLVTPIINAPSVDGALYRQALATGQVHELSTPMTAQVLNRVADNMDVIYTDSWIDMEFFHDPAYQVEKEFRIKTMLPYQINAALLEGSHAVVMHDMPIHAGYEITRDIAEKHMDTILRQAENRRHAQNAAMLYLLAQTGAAEF